MRLVSKLGTVLVLLASQLALGRGGSAARPSMPDSDVTDQAPATSPSGNKRDGARRRGKAKAAAPKGTESQEPAKPTESSDSAAPSAGGGW